MKIKIGAKPIIWIVGFLLVTVPIPTAGAVNKDGLAAGLKVLADGINEDTRTRNRVRYETEAQANLMILDHLLQTGQYSQPQINVQNLSDQQKLQLVIGILQNKGNQLTPQQKNQVLVWLANNSNACPTCQDIFTKDQRYCGKDGTSLVETKQYFRTLGYNVQE